MMKKKILSLLLVLVMVLGMFPMSAMAVEGEVAEAVSLVPVTGITLDKTQVTVESGDTFTLVATVAPENATDKTVEWTSSHENIATVENGKVTAVSAGETYITAKSGDFSISCIVTVTAASQEDPDDSQTTITLPESAIVSVGKTIALKAAVNPENDNIELVWASSDESIASVDANGVVSGKKKGMLPLPYL